MSVPAELFAKLLTLSSYTFDKKLYEEHFTTSEGFDEVMNKTFMWYLEQVFPGFKFGDDFASYCGNMQTVAREFDFEFENYNKSTFSRGDDVHMKCVLIRRIFYKYVSDHINEQMWTLREV